MSNLVYRDDKFIFDGMNGEQVLLNCRDYLSNKSRISMHKLPGQDFLTIPEMLSNMLRRERENGEELVFPMVVIDTLLAAQLIRTSQPVRVLEYGCLDGRLSWHLAEMLGNFHEESTLVCAYDTIEPEWMRRIAGVKKPPKLSYLAGDFGRLHLQQEFFDIVVVNGMVNFQEPQEVLEDAMQLVSESGLILCYTDHTPLLESVFRLYFEIREEYEISPFMKVLCASVEDCCWKTKECG